MDPQSGLSQGRHLVQGGRYTEAVRVLQQAAYHRPEWPDVHHLLGVALSLAGEPLRAESHLQRAVELNPDYAEAQLNLAILLSERGAYHAAREHWRVFDRLVRRDGADLPEAALNDLAQRHADLAAHYQGYGLFEEAEAQMQQALRLCPGYADLRLRLARLLFERGNVEGAAEQLQRVLQGRPDLDGARLLEGQLEQARGRPAAARDAWSRVRTGAAAVQARALLATLQGGASPPPRDEPEDLDRVSWGLR